ncbi:MAG: endonuclease domain-containing protein, partial [Acidimicrobiia bacterium]
EVTTVRSRRYRGSNVTVHTTLRWARIDVSSWQGIRVTTPARTLIDLGAVLRPERVEEAVDFALREGLVSLPMLRWRHSELRGRGCRGAGVIAPILEARTVGRVPESRYEREFIRLARDLGLPDPELQYEIRSGGRVIARVDFAWPDLRIVVEIDGHLGHSTRQQRAHDATRENQIKLEGWQVFRFTTDQVFRRDPEMVRVLLAAFVPPLLVTLDRA